MWSPRAQVLHKLIRRGMPAEVTSRYFRCYQEAERQFQASHIPIVRCAALDVMVRACIVDDTTGEANKGKLVTLMKQVLRVAAVKPNPVFKLMEVLLKGLIDLCEAFPEIISTAMSTLVNMLIDDVRCPVVAPRLNEGGAVQAHRMHPPRRLTVHRVCMHSPAVCGR